MKHELIILICTIDAFCSQPELQATTSLLTNSCNVIELSEIASHMQKTTAETLNTLCSSQKHVTVIKFSSDKQCGTCALFAPVFARAAQNIRSLFTGNKLYDVIYIGVESSIHQDLLRDYGISIIPTVLAYHNGKLIAANTKPYSAFEKYILSIANKINDN
jgi:hypothetical protein